MKIAVSMIAVSILLSMGTTSSFKTGNLRSLMDNGEDGVDCGLPSFSVNTNGFAIVDEPKVLGDFSISSGGATIFSGNLGIELRGSSSLSDSIKNSYGFETRDEEDSDMDVSLLGLPEEEDWILNGPYSDKTLMRNVLIYDISRDMGRYASRTRFVDLNVNGDYQGVYVLMEKLKRDKERIDISKTNDSDITGGYVFKVDRTKDGTFTDNNSFVSQFGSDLNATESADVYYVYDYPKADDITQEQKGYISSYVNDFETALASDNFTHPVNGNRYEAYVDVDSFVDFIILNEISNNVDAYRLSTFMHKDAGGKLEMGPIWDFNLGFGNANYCFGFATDVWSYRFNTYCKGDTLQTAFWWTRLVEDPVFVTLLKSRWSELRVDVLSVESIFSKIDSYVAELAGSVDGNFEKWDILGSYIWPNSFIGQTYAEEVDFLKSWISERLFWMDGAIAKGDM